MIIGPNTPEEVEKPWGFWTTAKSLIQYHFGSAYLITKFTLEFFRRIKISLDNLNLKEKYGKVVKCVICHGEDIKVMDVKEGVVFGNDIVYIPIKVPVCKTCGERYYDR